MAFEIIAFKGMLLNDRCTCTTYTKLGNGSVSVLPNLVIVRTLPKLLMFSVAQVYSSNLFHILRPLQYETLSCKSQ